MSHGNQSYLRFSLEESVWFQRGQEVEELISISLDPNIAINESDQYVTIKGSLELNGEYNRDEQTNDEENDFFSNPKFVQTVEVRGEGVYFFTHHFPVEITIPKNRIQDIENIEVAVETFDYAFPDRSCLRLSADLMITGLYGEQQHEYLQEEEEFLEEELDDEEEPEYAPLYREDELEDDQETEFDDETVFLENQEIPIADFSGESRFPFSRPDIEEEEGTEEAEEAVEGLYEPFEVEARKEAKADETLKSLTEEMEREEIQRYQQFKQEQEPITETYDFLLQEKEENHAADYKPEEIEKEDSKTAGVPEIFFAAKRKEAQAEGSQTADEEPQEIAPLEESQPVLETQPASEIQPLQETQPVSEVEPAHEQEVESPEDESSPEPKGKKKKWKKKQSLSITEFLARKEEESETHTRVKVCIVQKDDTIDKLSDRYDVTVSQLQRVNNLELNQDVYEGQVLYIPVVQNQK
ncbi:LysM peptidoglycan-binding domain-containing protein [Bacillus benzoevorans]|uniref:Stage VI sporulation protein D n=1 Tax=Bacillus benzoevorans TaxID=1456 RepID=A0A7X0HS35_9BACI|nr:LysM peptidoglycan-binding domain-containing protein [Bacillus benzoevorans]MBB6445848.1 stage VI sporulation protein D [Bacillus benzoevorans]